MITNFEEYIKTHSFEPNVQPSIDYKTRYKDLAKQFKMLGNCYNNVNSVDIRDGFYELAGYLDTLSDMCVNPLVDAGELKELKRVIFKELSGVLDDMEMLQEAYPDEVTPRYIISCKIVLKEFAV